MAKTNKTSPSRDLTAKKNMSLDDIKKIVGSAIKQNPLVFRRLAEI